MTCQLDLLYMSMDDMCTYMHLCECVREICCFCTREPFPPVRNAHPITDYTPTIPKTFLLLIIILELYPLLKQECFGFTQQVQSEYRPKLISSTVTRQLTASVSCKMFFLCLLMLFVSISIWNWIINKFRQHTISNPHPTFPQLTRSWLYP